MTDDAELLCRYCDKHSEAAFAELVRRHVDLVYSSALRQMRGDHHRAQEVTQMVFTDLARKASALIRHPVLAAWLHRSSHLAAMALKRKEGRRLVYEKAAGSEAGIGQSEDPPVDWENVGPVLDGAINELDERDRQAILLRFFGNRPFGEVGQRLKLSENAARMRVERALGKLHERLVRGGITSSSAALAAALAAQSVAAAPAGVAATSAAMALGVSGGATTAWVTLMATSKLPLALTAALLLGGTALVAVQQRAQTRSAQDLADLKMQDQAIPAIRLDNGALASAAAAEQSLMDESAADSLLRQQVSDAEAEAEATEIAAEATVSAMPAHPKTLPEGAPVYSFSQLDQRPKILKQGRPNFPNELANVGSAGEVLVDFIVGNDGLVYNAFASSSSNRSFEESAVQAVSQWVFDPGQVAGQNVFTHMQVPIIFTLGKEPTPPTPGTWF
jgi:RNA polymerase sigma factor (sigma-70 family)